MLLKHRFVPLPQSKEGMKHASQEDAWLNDVGPQTRPSKESKLEVPSPVDPLTQPRVEQGSSNQELVVAQANTYIGVGHSLWPVVLRLSERVWQELYQRPDVVSAPESLLMSFVQKRTIDMLRVEPELAQQIRDVAEAKLLLRSVGDEVLGYGPLALLMKDDSVSEVMAVGPRYTYIKRGSEIVDVPCSFEDDQHMLRIVENMLRLSGRRIKSDWPIVDVRLPDGSLVNVVMPPSAVNGPTITIRKGSKKPLTIDDLIQLETLSHDMAEFLRACIQARLNIVICGGIDSGRTTLLNALSGYIPIEERIATIEKVAELRLSQRHVVPLVSQLTSTSAGSAGGVTMRDLVVNALHIGSERILLGECRGDEVLEMLQAMNMGYGGFLMTLYAHDLRNCLTHLETMCMATSPTMPITMIRAQIATALDVIVHISRLPHGSRKVLNIAEVQYLEHDVIKLQSIFHYKDAGFDPTSGERKRSFEPSGFGPTFLPKFETMDIHLPPEMFKPSSPSFAEQG